MEEQTWAVIRVKSNISGYRKSSEIAKVINKLNGIDPAVGLVKTEASALLNIMREARPSCLYAIVDSTDVAELEHRDPVWKVKREFRL